MSSLFVVVLLVAIVGLIVGLTNPAVVKMQSRKNVSIVFGIIILVLIILVGKTSDQNKVSTVTAVAPTTTTTAPVDTTVTPVTSPTKTTVIKNITPITKTQDVIPKPISAPIQKSIPAPQTVVLLNISGSGSKSTQSFTAPSNNWQLGYTYDCSAFGTKGNFQVMIYNQDGSLSDNNLVNELGNSGNDTEYYHKAGSYYLEVNSECSWTIQVKG